MFNEKSAVWIARYKKWVVVNFWVLLIGGIILGIGDLTTYIDILWGDSILDLLLWPIVFAILAYFELLFGMLVLNLLNNIQTIREKIEQPMD